MGSVTSFAELVSRVGNQAHNSPAQLPAGGVAGRAQVRSSTRATRRLASRNLDSPTYAPHFQLGTLAERIMKHFVPSSMTTLIDSPVRSDLAESTSPPLTLGHLADPATLASLALDYGTSRGDTELRELIAAGVGVDAGQVLVTVGAIEAMFLLAQATCGPGDRVLLATPCFPPARTVPEGLGAHVDEVPLSFDDGYRLPLDRVAAALTPRTRLVSLASPQNPTGIRFTDDELRGLLTAVRDRAPWAVVLIDETYREATYAD